MWETVSSATLKDNRNRYEDELLYRFSKVVPEGVGVTVVADRGFADCNLFKYLEEDLGFGYVIRLPASYYVTSESGERRLASQWVGPAGRMRTLRNAQVTDAHLLTVGTVVCLRDKNMKDVWCLVASDRNATPRLLIRYYAKRWGIETSFRDLKDPRYGLGLSSMRVSRPDRRDRLLLLSVLAIALLSLLGAAGERIGYDRWLKVNTVKHRTHSLFRQGHLLCRVIDPAETQGNPPARRSGSASPAGRAARSVRLWRAGGPNMARREGVPEGSVSLVQARRTRSLDHFMTSGWAGTGP